mgnify:CR=1 FL=1
MEEKRKKYDTFRNIKGKNIPVRTLRIPQKGKFTKGLCPVCGYVNTKKSEGCSPCIYCRQLLFFQGNLKGGRNYGLERISSEN